MQRPAPTIAIRLDYSPVIGSGHLFRCLTLANALAEAGRQIVFVSTEADPRPVFGLAFEHEWRVMPGSTARPEAEGPSLAHAHFRRHPQARDAELFAEAIMGLDLDWILVDHYGLDARWHRAVRGLCRRIAVIDDLADRALDADLLIDQNRDRAADYDALLPAHCSRLVGPGYALLGKTYADRHQHQHPRHRLDRVLVFFGSADPTGMVERVLPVLAEPRFAEVKFTVVTGALARPGISGQWPANIELTPHVSDMAALLDDVDLAIGSCGTHSFERTCLGVPAICLPVAENQRMIFAMLQARGVILPIDSAPAPEAAIGEALAAVMAGKFNLENMSRLAYSVTDGRGIDNIVKALTKASSRAV